MSQEDITQDVFLILLREPDRFKPPRGELRPFLLGVARNLVLKMLPRDKNRWGVLEEEQFTAQPLHFGAAKSRTLSASR